MSLTPTAEDYLLAIATMEHEGQGVIAARLAERLHVSPASVSQTIERMVRNELVAVETDHHIRLTSTGQTEANTIVRRHRLTERFLTDILHLDWSQAHLEAHRLEHAISDLVEERLSALLHHPATCPHGSPIPGNFPEGADRAWVMLQDLVVGNVAEIARVSELVEEDQELLQYCDDKNLKPGTTIRIQEKGPDGLIVVTTNGDSVAVPDRLNAQIFCRPTAPSTARS